MTLTRPARASLPPVPDPMRIVSPAILIDLITAILNRGGLQ